MRSIPFTFGLLLSIFWAASVYADDTSCWATAPQESDVWAIIYNADADGNRGDILWEGKIAAGQKVKIISTDGNIRYDYKRDPSQPYEGDVPVACFGENTFLIQ